MIMIMMMMMMMMMMKMMIMMLIMLMLMIDVIWMPADNTYRECVGSEDHALQFVHDEIFISDESRGAPVVVGEYPDAEHDVRCDVVVEPVHVDAQHERVLF